jgi:hypothetical protein
MGRRAVTACLDLQFELPILLFHVREVPSLNVGPKADHPDTFTWLTSLSLNKYILSDSFIDHYVLFDIKPNKLKKRS